MAAELFSKHLEQIGEGSAFVEQLRQMISETRFFEDLSWTQVGVLAGYMKAYSAPAGITLFQEGSPGNYLCLLISGKVDVIKNDMERHSKTVYTVPPGRILGEMSIVDGHPRSATCITKEPVTLAILTRENFHQLLEKDPALGADILLKMARLLSERLRRTSGLLVDYLEH